MRPKSIVLLLLALGCGLIASIGITQVIRQTPKEVVIKEGMTPILVAKVDIPMGEPANTANVKLESWPQDSIPPGALTKLSDIEGRRTRVEIFSGEPVITKKLLPKGATTSTATEFIPKGYRVVAVEVDKSDGAGLIMPGDRVDVLLNVRRNENLGIPEDRTQTILQDVKVFAVDDTFKLGASEKSNISMSAKTISLLVTPQQAEKLDLGAQLGKIRLVMRGTEDKDIVEASSISIADLLGITEGSDRDAEVEEEPKEKGGLLGFIEGMNKKKVDETRSVDAFAGDPIRTWTVRVLQGGEMQDVKLEEFKDGDQVQWRVESPLDEDGKPKKPDASTAALSTSDTSDDAEPDASDDAGDNGPDWQEPDSDD